MRALAHDSSVTSYVALFAILCNFVIALIMVAVEDLKL